MFVTEDANSNHALIVSALASTTNKMKAIDLLKDCAANMSSYDYAGAFLLISELRFLNEQILELDSTLSGPKKYILILDLLLDYERAHPPLDSETPGI